MKTYKNRTIISCTLLAVLLVGSANAATYNWSGGTAVTLDSTNYDLGTTPYNGVADDVYITGGGLVLDENNYSLEALDTYHVTSGGVIQNIKDGNKAITGGGAIVNVGSGGTYAPGNRMESTTVNLAGSGVLLYGNAGDTVDPRIRNGSVINLDLAWAGEIYFVARPTFDEVSELLTWLDSGDGAGNIIYDGNALTSAGLGSIYQVNVVTTGSGNEPAFATSDAGLSLTLIPEPNSMAMLALGGVGLCCIRRRRRLVAAE